jgi:stage V sporulation protein SpoVS
MSTTSVPSAMSDDFDAITELRVAASTPPKDLAGSIIYLLNDNKQIRLSAIGHQSVGQAIKAIPIVNSYTAAQGYVISIFPYFELMKVKIRDTEDERNREPEERTVMMLKLVKVSPQ